MNNVSQSIERTRCPRLTAGIVYLAFVVCLGGGRVAGQSVAEYGHLTSGARAASTSTFKGQAPAFKGQAPNPATNSKSAHLPARSGEAPEVVNRRALEQLAGADAAKLSLVSTPPNALVRVDGKVVGNTPLLLVLPPGIYFVEMEGPTKTFARSQLSIRPKETREVVLSLRSRYPVHVQLR